MCYPCDRGIVLPICPGYTPPGPGIHPGAMIVRPSAAGSHKFVAHPGASVSHFDPDDKNVIRSLLESMILRHKAKRRSGGG